MGHLPGTDHVSEKSKFDVIPPGKYVVIVKQTEQVETAAGDAMLKLECEVVEGEYAGKKIFDSLMLVHSNPDAEEIGLRKLKQLKLAVGKPQAREEQELWDIPVIGRVSIQKDKTGQYDDQNRISKFEPLGTAQAGATHSLATATPPVHSGGERTATAGKGWRGSK